MNRVRRKRIEGVIKTLEQSREEIEDILSVEEAYYAIDNLNEAIDDLNEAIYNLEEAR